MRLALKNALTRRASPAHTDQEQDPAWSEETGAADDGGFYVDLPKGPGPKLTADLARSVRFNLSEPQGYYFDQVDEFVAQVAEALGYHENQKYMLEKAVHDLRTELDNQVFDVQRLRTQIELFKVQGNPLVNDDGSFVTESQVSAGQAQADARQTQLQEALAAAEEARARLESELASVQVQVQVKDQEIVGLRGWGDQMIADAHERNEELAALAARVADLEAENAALRGAAASPEVETPTEVSPEPTPAAEPEDAAEPIPAEPAAEDAAHDSAESVAAAETPAEVPTEPIPTEAEDEAAASDGAESVTAVETSAEVPTEPIPAEPEDAEDAEDDGDQPVAVPVIPVDSELPEGVELPLTEEGRGISYPEASPGAPLSHGEVPLPVWAPELDPRVVQAMNEAAAYDEDDEDAEGEYDEDEGDEGAPDRP